MTAKEGGNLKTSGRARVAFALVLFAFIWVCVTTSAAAATKLPVHFAGFAYAGEYADVARSYPYTVALQTTAERPRSPLDQALRAALKDLQNTSFTLVFDELASLQPGSSETLVLAVVLDGESVSVEQIGAQFKVLVELSAQALFVDFREMAVAASFPLVFQFKDIQSSPPGPELIAEAVQRLYFGNGSGGLIGGFAELLADVDVGAGLSRRIRVTDVTISDSARQELAEWAPGQLEASLAHDFSKYLSRNNRIPVLPYAKGYAIGNRMAASFADGRVYSLQIPEADYTISLGLSDLKRVEFAKTAAGTSFVYGAFLDVLVQEPLSGTKFFEARVRNGATKVVPVTQESVDNSAAFRDALLALIDKFTKAAAAPSADWAERHLGERGKVQQLKALGEVLQLCR